MVLRYESGGGIVGRDSVYVSRLPDKELPKALEDARRLCLITAPRQSGKSSLATRVSNSLKSATHRSAYIDLRQAVGLPEQSNNNSKRWYGLLFQEVIQNFDLNAPGYDAWIAANDELPSSKKVVAFFSDFCRKAIKGRSTLFIDELDFVSLFGGFTDGLFDGLRTIANDETLALSVVLLSVNHPSELLKTLTPSIFNVFSAYELSDFEATPDSIAEWASGLSLSPKSKRDVGAEVLYQTGGQPYLTSVLFRRALDAGAKNARDVKVIAEHTSNRDDTQLKVHFDTPGEFVLRDPGRAWPAMELFKKALQGPILSSGVPRQAVALLKTAGLVHEHNGRIEVKSPIYARVFDENWVEETKSRIGQSSHRARSFSVARAEEQKTICVINTGGMISMEQKPGGDIGEPQDLQAFFSDFPEMQDIANIATLGLMCKDSSNISPDDWASVANAIYQRRNRSYCGFVVCHGTDTLAYTASAVAFALGPGLKVPVVFTASQVPRHTVYGDARINILRACKVATQDIPEVVVSIGDHVYRAVCVEKKDDYRFDAFHSPSYPPLATITKDVEIQKTLLRKPDETRGMECQVQFSEGVLKISFYPGLSPKFLLPMLDNPVLRGLIIETPGIGVLPTDGEYSLMKFVETATERLIPVLLVSQYPIQTSFSKAYEIAKIPVQAGAIPAGSISAPAAVTKFMWVLSQVEQRIARGDVLREDKLSQIAEYMSRNLVGELTNAGA